ncbi:unnamed protein product [Phytomonas sp. Hart1]|nr:unnamed protein product [Phytomonas sp. Hart1]|eukprot:CCW69665.1 unnamed protein product [Phytomonas sp. isolate Hart1]
MKIARGAKTISTGLLAQSRSSKIKARIRRSFVVGFIGTLLLVFWLLYADNSNQIPVLPTVLSKDDIQGIFVRTTGPRVVILIMSDKIDDTLCYSVGSAYLSGLPVVVAGYQMKYKGFLSKFDFMERAIKNAQMNPEDIAILIDSDTVFTGADIQAFLDSFIAQSAATPEELDALSVRQGRAMAPIVALAEDCCWAPNLYFDHKDCAIGYEAVHKKVREHAAAHPENKLALAFDQSPYRHSNMGIVIVRVWAYMEYLGKVKKLTEILKPTSRIERGWYCDQSIFSRFYLDLLTWEVEQDVFSMPLHERQAARSTYGIRAGFLGLDYANALSVVIALRYIHQTEIHDELWAKYLPSDGLEHPHSHEIDGIDNVGLFVADLYKRAYVAHGTKIYTKLAVPKWIDGKRTSEKIFISLTPPLFASKLRPIDTFNNTTRHTFPVILHASDLENGYTKVKKLEYASVGAPWFMPMVYDAEVLEQNEKRLESLPLFLSTDRNILQTSYHANCGFPFERIIKKVQNI